MPSSPTPIEAEALTFAKSYASLFANVEPSMVPEISKAVSKCYQPGVTFFTNGAISRFETQEESAHLIKTEMQKAFSDGLGVCLLIQDIKVVPYSNTAVTCYLTWKFQPQAGSEFADRPWTFINIYGYRASVGGGESGGWEYIVRDNEVGEMKKATGMDFSGGSSA